MRYVFEYEYKTPNNAYVREFDDLMRAINHGSEIFNTMSDRDIGKLDYFHVIRCNNPDPDSDDHYCGEIEFDWIEIVEWWISVRDSLDSFLDRHLFTGLDTYDIDYRVIMAAANELCLFRPMERDELFTADYPTYQMVDFIYDIWSLGFSDDEILKLSEIFNLI